MDNCGTTDSSTCEAIRSEWHQIAKTEVARHGRRLDVLTPKQKSELESLLVSVADHMLDQVILSARKLSASERLNYLKVWRRNHRSLTAQPIV